MVDWKNQGHRTPNFSALSIPTVKDGGEFREFVKEDFTTSFLTQGGKVVRTDCDFSAPNFNPKAIISHAISDGAYGLLLSPTSSKINPAIDLLQANKTRLKLFGNQSMYTIKTVQLGQAGSNGLVLAVAWHPTALSGNPFPDRAAKFWGGPVNWRTAMAYDATQVIITGLMQSNTRDGLLHMLHNPGFSVKGATGRIEFLPSGDRKGEANLLIIEPGSASGTGYDFVPSLYLSVLVRRTHLAREECGIVSMVTEAVLYESLSGTERFSRKNQKLRALL